MRSDLPGEPLTHETSCVDPVRLLFPHETAPGTIPFPNNLCRHKGNSLPRLISLNPYRYQKAADLPSEASCECHSAVPAASGLCPTLWLPKPHIVVIGFLTNIIIVPGDEVYIGKFGTMAHTRWVKSKNLGRHSAPSRSGRLHEGRDAEDEGVDQPLP